MKSGRFAGGENQSTNNKGSNTTRDRISELPDDILASIVSCLTLRDGLRTSVLGRRWRYLWTSIPVLDFDPTEQPLRRDYPRVTWESIPISYVDYVNRVNAVVNLHSGQEIEKFRVKFNLGRESIADIDSWVKFALEKRVKKLELDMTACDGGACFDGYIFPNICVEKGRQRIMPPGLSTLSFLKTLCLRFVAITGEVLEYILSVCPFLELLCVEGSKSLTNLKIRGTSSHRLKNLVIRSCHLLEKVEICAPNLMSFIFYASRPSVVLFALENVPQLVNLSIGHPVYPLLPREIRQFYSIFGQLETLTLQIMTLYENFFGFLAAPILQRLTKLVLDVRPKSDDISLLCFFPLINAAPSLKELTVKLWGISESLKQRTVRQANGRLHQCLKVVEIIGFVGRAVDVELTMYLVKHAVKLEKIIIDPLEVTAGLHEINEERAKRAREHAKQLATKLPAGVALVIR